MQLFIWYYVVLLALPPLRGAISVPASHIVVLQVRWVVYVIALIVLSRIIARLDDESPWRLFAPLIAIAAIIAAEILNLAPIPLARLIVDPLILLSNRGLAMPALAEGEGFTTWLAFVVVGLVLGLIVHAALGVLRDRAGRRAPRLLIGLVVWIAAMVIGWGVAGDAPLVGSLPARTGLRYSAGTILLPEYSALLIGLAIYTAAYIAEIVRAGIQSVPRGQIEASRALGLSYMETLRLIILPQALRVIIPPLGNQYLNLAKNSSLGVAIAFTEVFQVTSTIINQSGQAVTGILLIMACYLTLSLIISTGLNLINRRFQLVTR
jgi:general L-amino acid transport system permease protein